MFICIFITLPSLVPLPLFPTTLLFPATIPSSFMPFVFNNLMSLIRVAYRTLGTMPVGKCFSVPQQWGTTISVHAVSPTRASSLSYSPTPTSWLSFFRVLRP